MSDEEMGGEQGFLRSSGLSLEGSFFSPHSTPWFLMDAQGQQLRLVRCQSRETKREELTSNYYTKSLCSVLEKEQVKGDRRWEQCVRTHLVFQTEAAASLIFESGKGLDWLGKAGIVRRQSL